MITDNLQKVKENIIAACERAGRNYKDVTLIAVSKTKPMEAVKELYDNGHKIFGENYVQEFVKKEEELPKDIEWHMIGHLQRNKVKYLIDRVKMIHSVDSIRLAEEISRQSEKKGIITEILAEINVAGEENKFGITPEELIPFAQKVSLLPGIKLSGIMTSAPFVSDPEENRHIFKKMKDLCVDTDKKNIDNIEMKYLSMGMTNDYIVAVEEGATHVRVGTAIFGARDYS